MKSPLSSHQTENKEMSRAGGITAAGTLFSRILGLVRNQILSHYFGAGLASDAFIAAFTIPNALRRLLGEGALTPAFVSLFTRELQKGDEQASRDFVSNSFWWLSFIGGLLCLIGILLSPWLVRLYVPDFVETPGKYELSVQLTQFLFPFLLLISWAALFMGVFNSRSRFAIPALGPAALNLVVLCVTPLAFWLLQPEEELGIFIFSGAILLGVSIQVLLFLPGLKRMKFFPQWRFQWRDPRVLTLGMLLLPSVLSMGIHQLNIIVNRVFASPIPGAVSHLFYADLLIELPVAILATSMAVAALPSLTRLYISGDRKALSETFSYAAGLNLMLALPSMGGLMILSEGLISSLFFTGEFSRADLETTTSCLFYYSLGLPFFCALRSLLPLYFAMKDTRTPALVGLVALGVNALSAWQLSAQMGAAGIALATSISSFVNFGLLLIIVVFRFRDFAWGKIFSYLVHALILTSLMLVGLHYLLQLEVFDQQFQKSGLLIPKFLLLLGVVIIGMLIYGVACLFIPQNPLKDLLLAKFGRSNEPPHP